MTEAKFVSALRFKWYTPLYDFFIGRSMPENKIKQSLIDISYLTGHAFVMDYNIKN